MQGEGAYTLVQDSSSASNLLELSRTFFDHTITEIAWCSEFCNMSSGRFDYTEHSVPNTYVLVWGRSSALNFLKPFRN